MLELFRLEFDINTKLEITKISRMKLGNGKKPKLLYG